MFKSIDKHVLMMIESDGFLKIKITNPKKSAVKCTRVRLEDVFDYNPPYIFVFVWNGVWKGLHTLDG